MYNDYVKEFKIKYSCKYSEVHLRHLITFFNQNTEKKTYIYTTNLVKTTYYLIETKYYLVRQHTI